MLVSKTLGLQENYGFEFHKRTARQALTKISSPSENLIQMGAGLPSTLTTSQLKSDMLATVARAAAIAAGDNIMTARLGLSILKHVWHLYHRKSSIMVPSATAKLTDARKALMSYPQSYEAMPFCEDG